MSFGRLGSMGRGFGRLGSGGGRTASVPNVLSAGAGSYSWTGQAASLIAARTLAAAGGSYTYTGQDASLVRSTISLGAGAGSYAWTGDPMTPLVDYKLPATGGSYTYSGTAASLLATRLLAASGGSYTYTGQDATLTKSASTTTLNPSDKAAAVTLSGGNLIMTTSSGPANARSIASHSSGKYYFEVVFSAAAINTFDKAVGIANSTQSLTGFPTEGTGGADSATIFQSSASFGVTVGVSDRLGVAVDMTAKLIWMRVNGGNWGGNATHNPATGVGGFDISSVSQPWFVLGEGNANTAALTFNFGGSAYTDSAPAGFGNW